MDKRQTYLATVKHVDLSIEHGILTYHLVVEYDFHGCIVSQVKYGPRLDNDSCLEKPVGVLSTGDYLRYLMDVLGVKKLSDAIGRNVRIKLNKDNEIVRIGHETKTLWTI